MSDNWIVSVNKLAGVEWFLHHMTGTEALGRPFSYDLEILADVKHVNLDLDKLLGGSMTVTVGLPNDRVRHFNGLISEASFAGLRGQQASFRVTLRPWMWLLTKNSDCRIYQELSVPEIIKEVFRDHGFSEFEDQLSKTYRPRDYCVQYRESHFDFVSRLLEDEGIYYYWVHAEGKHTLVLADSVSAHGTVPGYDKIVYRSVGEAQADQDHIMEWSLRRQVCTSAFAVDSYDFESPKADLAARNQVSRQHQNADHERYDFGSLYTKSSVGDNYAKVRREELNTRHTVARAHGNARGVSCGALFSLDDYPRADQNAEYLIIDAEYFVVNSDRETGSGDATASFDVEFTAIESSTQFRPERATPKASIRGPQTAVVVGKSGEDIWTDKYGRVKVQFHWDDEGKTDEQSSCWVRVAHAWAGKTWGTIAIPRIGQEVIVDFLEGDPDQPVITGSVYNQANMPPYTLPDNQTQSGIKTRSSKGGNDKTFNELRFEDKKGSEEIYFQAERDFKRVVKNNDTLEVGLEHNDKGDQDITIHRNRSVELKTGSDKLKVEKKIAITAGDELSIKVGQSSLTMKKNGDIELKGVNFKLKCKKDVTIDAKKDVKIDAKKDITAKAALNVKVDGLMISIGGKAKADIKAPMVDVNADAMAKLKGGITMIG